jgi:AraC-like DNA-binding protein
MFSRSRILPDPTWSGIAVPKALLPLPTTTSATVVRQRRHRWLPKPPEPGDFAGSVRAVITTLLGEGYPEIETTAEILGLRTRTLQRFLAARGVRYRGLVNQARFEAARNLLGRSEASITEIGYDLGYQDHSHFSRAFKRWAGISPSAFRATAAAPAPTNGSRLVD